MRASSTRGDSRCEEKSRARERRRRKFTVDGHRTSNHFSPAHSLCVSLRWPPQQRAEFTLGLSHFQGRERRRDGRISRSACRGRTMAAWRGDAAGGRQTAERSPRKNGPLWAILSIGLVSVVLRVGLVVSRDNGRLMLARPSVCSIGKLKDGHPDCHDC